MIMKRTDQIFLAMPAKTPVHHWRDLFQIAPTLILGVIMIIFWTIHISSDNS
jgi:hypothetical protein